MSKVYSSADLHQFRERVGVPKGNVRTEIAGHGQYQCTAVDLDALIEEHWGDSVEKLRRLVKETQGDPEYDTHGLAKIELIMIIAELSGFATN
jgi:hypothetical protein